MNESEYTPTDDAVRRKYARGMKSDGTPTQFVKWQKEFDRWIAQHDAELRAKIAAEIRGELPIQLAEMATAMQDLLQEVEGFERVFLSVEWDPEIPLGSIDLEHIAEHAADIAERSGK